MANKHTNFFSIVYGIQVNEWEEEKRKGKWKGKGKENGGWWVGKFKLYFVHVNLC